MLQFLDGVLFRVPLKASPKSCSVDSFRVPLVLGAFARDSNPYYSTVLERLRDNSKLSLPGGKVAQPARGLF